MSSRPAPEQGVARRLRGALPPLGCLLLALFAWRAPALVVLVPCAEEVARAGDTASKIFSTWPLRPSGDPVDRALQQITNELALRAGESPHRRWRTHVVRDAKLNAFSIGDGHIFVTEGMLRLVATEAELAALLAHEFAHHIAGHFCTPVERPSFVGRLFGAGPAASAEVGDLSGSLDPGREREADRISTIMLARAGYDPRAALALASRMAGSGAPAHFEYGERLAALRDAIAATTPVQRAHGDGAAFTRLEQSLREDDAWH
ncbi:MAG: M48 family metalloprotease [Gammaproteobacteria bacterium]|nr:M48 family metalloprotease [Gammaproteobacteria bacterium]MBI5616502.1 M48 family metalloprotease [Gammaproteobacteria bacterium]